ncbi:MAG: FecR domain-containing protein [Mucilaginibacter sp.]|uniref:FecR domain-containing protein n=1 Tax=Mucilaginibacter sp. TaxID=1882438 RepID=UPI0031A6B093
MNKHLHINDELLISYLLKEVSAVQAREVEEWRAADTANEHRFEQFRLIWDSSKNFTADPDIDARASLQKVKQRAAMQRSKVVPLYNRYNWLKIAAALMMIAGCAWLFIKHNNRHVEFATQETVKSDTLSDGSVVTLNKYALLSYPHTFKGSQRNVDLLKGEAFFSVTPNKAKPFIISTGNTTIRVVGTSFNVKNKNGAVEVIVETGIVQVSQGQYTVSLHPGEMALIQAHMNKPVKANSPDHLYNYYRSKEFVADNVPLYRMVEVLNEAYGSHITIERKELNKLPLNTTFKTDDSLDDILKVISHTFKITIEQHNNHIILK